MDVKMSMPQRFGSKRTFSAVGERKLRSAKRRKTERKTTVLRVTGFPPRQVIAKLKYNLGWINTTDVMDNNIINLNSTFDPEESQTGHQPMGRDTMVTLYNRYLVTRCDVKLTIQAVGSTSSPKLVTVVANNTATAFTNSVTAAEQPGAVLIPCNIGAPTVWKRVYYPARITGVTDAMYRSDDRFQALGTASPSEAICLHILTTDGSGSPLGASSINVNVELVYHTLWFDPFSLGQS